MELFVRILLKKGKLNKFVVVNKDPIMPYIDYFRRFVEQVEKTVKQQQQTERKDTRKEQGIIFWYLRI
jgi:hypothetical protein